MTPLLNRHRVLVSWGVLALLVLLLLSFIATPLVEKHDSYRLELIRDGRILQRLQSVAGSRQELEAAASQFQQRNLSEWVFPANQDPDTVVLTIQKRLSEILTASKANIRSIAPVRAPSDDGYVLAGVRVQFNGSLEALLDVLRAIDASRPLLIVEDLRLVPAVSRILGPNAPQPQAVEAIITVGTYLPVAAADGALQ